MYVIIRSSVNYSSMVWLMVQDPLNDILLTTAAFDYLKRYPLDVDVALFENSCGVGIVVTAEDIKNEVRIL